MSTHTDAVSQVRPAVVAIIGSAVAAPERAAGQAGQWLAQFLATAPPAHRLALLDAFFEAAQTLAQAFEEIAPGALAPLSDEVPDTPGLPAAARAGVRDGLRMLIDGGGAIQRRKWLGYASGAVSDERFVAAALTLVGRAVDLVDGLASVTGMPVKQVWVSLLPVLSGDADD